MQSLYDFKAYMYRSWHKNECLEKDKFSLLGKSVVATF